MSEKESHLCCATIKANVDDFAHWYFNSLGNNEVPNFANKIEIIQPSSLRARIASLAARSFAKVYYLLPKDERQNMLSQLPLFSGFGVEEIETAKKAREERKEERKLKYNELRKKLIKKSL